MASCSWLWVQQDTRQVYGSNGLSTCDWCLDVQYSFLLTQDSCSLVDDSKCHSFLYTALLGEVGLQEIHTRFPFAVKHFLHCKAVAQGEGYSWGQGTGTWWLLSRVTMATVNDIENTILYCFCHCGEGTVANRIQRKDTNNLSSRNSCRNPILENPIHVLPRGNNVLLLHPSLLTVYMHLW